MKVTCYTDASFAARSGGRWAVWIRSDLGRIVRQGQCPPYVKTSTTAELAAIHAGINLAIDRWGHRVGTIDVRSDCRAALAMADGTGRARCDGAQLLHAHIQSLLRMHEVELRCGWVKAHQAPGTSKAAYLNNQCDLLARSRRRRRRKRR